MWFIKLYHRGALEQNTQVTLLFVLSVPFLSSALQTKPQFCLGSNPPAAGSGDNFLLVSISHKNLILYWRTGEHCTECGKVRHRENLLENRKSLFCLSPSFLL